jgi:hypothetical protein
MVYVKRQINMLHNRCTVSQSPGCTQNNKFTNAKYIIMNLFTECKQFIFQLNNLFDKNVNVIGIVYGSSDKVYHGGNIQQLVSRTVVANSPNYYVVDDASSLNLIYNDIMPKLCQFIPGTTQLILYILDILEPSVIILYLFAR